MIPVLSSMTRTWSLSRSFIGSPQPNIAAYDYPPPMFQRAISCGPTRNATASSIGWPILCIRIGLSTWHSNQFRLPLVRALSS